MLYAFREMRPPVAEVLQTPCAHLLTEYFIRRFRVHDRLQSGLADEGVEIGRIERVVTERLGAALRDDMNLAPGKLP